MRRARLVALAVAVGLATAASPFASSAPDGLNRIAADHGFGERGRLAAVQRHAPAGGYAIPGVGDARVAKGLAGFAGCLVVFLLVSGAGAAARRRPHRARAA
jgi:hypothetical protein